LTLLSSRGESSETPTSLILHSVDDSAAGSTDTFLSSHLIFKKDERGQDICLVQAGDSEVGVMMGWETQIMEETAKELCETHENLQAGLKVLNVGFGLGIIDNLFQSLPTPPLQHFIIEAHPDVLRHMKELGWYEKRGVKVLEGKWQDFIESEQISETGGFDVVYMDTFSENYKDLQQFFEHLPDLLSDPTSRFSFFNGLGATNALFYDVYNHLVELHLLGVGLNVRWSELDVNNEEGEDRWGTTREYFSLPLYRLPLGRMSVL
jgi:protein arginine N-methyltransferase 2